MRILLFMRNLRQSKGNVGAAPIKWNMILVALAMFVFASLDVAFGLRHNLDAFVYYTGSGGATAEFSLVSSWVNVMKSADFVAQTTIGDAILVCSCTLPDYYFIRFDEAANMFDRSTVAGLYTGSGGPLSWDP